MVHNRLLPTAGGAIAGLALLSLVVFPFGSDASLAVIGLSFIAVLACSGSARAWSSGHDTSRAARIVLVAATAAVAVLLVATWTRSAFPRSTSKFVPKETDRPPLRIALPLDR